MTLSPREAGAFTEKILAEVERAVVGKRSALELVLVGMLARGHILLEDYPGLAKTLAARSFARAVGLRLARVQFTPDLMPADVTGSSIYDPAARSLVFQLGPIFVNLVLGDEINRATPKTQAALLEAMAEQQVTVDGTTRALPEPFIVMATQNPIEFEGTYALPEAQLDRFLVRLQLGYPEHGDEVEMLERRLARRSERVELDEVVDRERFSAMQDAVEQVHVAPGIVEYVVSIVESTRRHPSVELGSSPRGSLALVGAARARAVVCQRDFVTPEDVKALAVPCLAHRISLRPELWVRGAKSANIIDECLATVPTPATDGEALGAGTPAAPEDPT